MSFEQHNRGINLVLAGPRHLPNSGSRNRQMTEAHKLAPRLFTPAETLLNYSETLQHIILIFYHALYGKQGLFSLYPSHF